MKAQELFQAGKLDEAVQALGAELRENPADAKRRTFLFERKKKALIINKYKQEEN
jgi:type VI secretion system protein ImpE